jgi:hypothetical protein
MNDTKNLFELATRERYRFPWHGMISVEDLWQLPQEELNNIYKQLMDSKHKTEVDSLMADKTKESSKALDNCIDIVKYIFQYKEDQKNAAIRAKEKAEKKQRILELMAKKQDEAMAEKSVEELEAMLEEL